VGGGVGGGVDVDVEVGLGVSVTVAAAGVAVVAICSSGDDPQPTKMLTIKAIANPIDVLLVAYIWKSFLISFIRFCSAIAR